jgi:hypothetical protein
MRYAISTLKIQDPISPTDVAFHILYFRSVDYWGEVLRTFVYISGRACMDNVTLEFRFDIQQPQ